MSGQSVLIANKRYRRDFLITMVTYAVVVCMGPFILARLESPQKWMFATLAILSAIPAAYVFVLMGRLLKETDEYMRQRLGSAMLAATGITVSFCFFWGFLELYRLVPHLWTFLVGPIFFASLGLVSIYRKVMGR